MTTEQTNVILSVSDYIADINSILKDIPVKITGEITSLKQIRNGHMSFTIKDKQKEAVLECLIWASKYEANGITLEEGTEIIISGTGNLYAPWGKFSFLVDTIELTGEGAIKRAYEQLKKKLTQEGLFAQERKRPLPYFPKNIGVITSKQGAVIYDFINNLGKFGFTIQFVNSRVEGKEALIDLIEAVNTLKNRDIDVLVIMRGGGSLQSLAAFDTEALVRTIADFPVPVITAIGHDKDIPLISFVADKAVSTPSIAAELLSKPFNQATSLVERYSDKIISKYSQSISANRNDLNIKYKFIFDKLNVALGTFEYLYQSVFQSVSKIRQSIKIYDNKLSYSSEKIFDDFDRYVEQAKNQIVELPVSLVFQRSLNNLKVDLTTIWSKRIIQPYSFALRDYTKSLSYNHQIISIRNPERLLKNGYSIVRSNNRIVKSVENVTIGEAIEISVSNGSIYSEVNRIENKNNG